MIRICVAGATGRMGKALISEALNKGFEIVGALASTQNPNIGRTLRELGICNLELPLYSPLRLKEALERADVYVSFTTPEAELRNIPEVVDLNKRIVMGTTGFTEEQLSGLKTLVSSRVPAVFASNFSLGLNLGLKMLRSLAYLPEGYEISVVEAHHSGKKDAPSGTAVSIANLISYLRGYSKIVHGRRGFSQRTREELEVLSVRAGGLPGIHEVIIAGPHEMITLQHISFSRSAFVTGALKAVEWIMKQSRPGVYSAEDVLDQIIGKAE